MHGVQMKAFPHNSIRSSWPRCRAVFLAPLLAAAACGGDGTPFQPKDDEPGPGDVQRAVLTVQVRAEAPDAGVAAALGFPGGAIPGARITLQRVGGTGADTATADAEGRAVFERLLPGTYRISAVRLLSAEERSRLAGVDAEVNAWGGGGAVDLAAPGAEAAVALTAGRPGTLVISELWFGTFDVQGTSYNWGQFTEIYNNSATTQYLDGKLIALPGFAGHDYGGVACSGDERWTNAPDGVWVRWVYRFPGTGTQYPLPPGQAVIVALEAIDHSALAEGQLDLSRADFEFESESGVDNPHVPNLVSVGPVPYGIGRGLMFSGLSDTAVLADAPDLNELPRDRNRNNDEILRIPADAVLDLASWWLDREFPNPPCPRQVNERFDRQGARVWNGIDRVSMQRRSLLTLPDGRVVLQRTRTSARDWMVAPPTPKMVPRP
jgi:hypothetical protein